MITEFCNNCGKYVLAGESTIRLSKDNESEVVCNVCLKAEQKRSAQLTSSESVVSLVSCGIIDCAVCGAS